MTDIGQTTEIRHTTAIRQN